MAVKVNIRDIVTGNEVEMLLEADSKIEDAIENIATYWQKGVGAYALKHKTKILSGKTTVRSAGIKNKDILELIPDPEGG